MDRIAPKEIQMFAVARTVDPPLKARAIARIAIFALIALVAIGAAFPNHAKAATATGRPGPYIADAVTCNQGFTAFGTTYPGSVLIRAPKLWARNTTSARDVESVAWAARVVRTNDWYHPVAQSGWRVATAYDNSWATFNAADAVFTSNLPAGYYYVIYDMYWYGTSAIAPSGVISIWAPGYASGQGGMDILSAYCTI
jgi:hypothetical protein